MSAQFVGKYRGVVVDTNDPEQTGRLKARVPDVLGDIVSAWAMPCVPAALPKKRGCALPKVGASVWVEFEGGNPDFPIWTGCFFGNAAETPPALRKAL